MILNLPFYEQMKDHERFIAAESIPITFDHFQ